VASWSLPLAAQDLSVGLRGGLSATSFVGETGWTARTGATGGAAITIGVHRLAAVQVEMLVTQAGGDLPAVSTVRFDYPAERASLTYFQVPLLARLRLESVLPGRVRPLIVAGPAFSALLGCQYRHDGATSWTDAGPWSCRPRGSVSRDGVVPAVAVPFGQIRTVDVGLLAGAGVEIALGPSLLTVEARYGQGLLSVDRVEAPGVRNAGWSFMLGLSRGIRRPFGP
jgi:hypothetical protein